MALCKPVVLFDRYDETDPTGNAVTVETVSKNPDRKIIRGAGILIIQPKVTVAAAWEAALLDFGMAGVRTCATADQAIELLNEKTYLGIVHAADNVGAATSLMNRLMAGEAGDLSGVPIVLVISQPTRAIEATALRLGYDDILAYPLHPRLIYRRMGSLMQKSRRAAKLREATEIGGGAVPVLVAAASND